METKKDIRKRVRSARAGLSSNERTKYSACIVNRLIEHPLYQEADEIYCYVSFGDEVSTSRILETSWMLGKKLAVPRILIKQDQESKSAGDGTNCKDTAVSSQSPGRYMEFFYIHSREELKEGYYGILEPVTTRKAQGRNVLVVMPGVAFDTSCHRIGYGGGFYDAYLKQHPKYRTIALAYSIQCLEQIPYEEYDIRPEIILTEKEIYTC